MKTIIFVGVEARQKLLCNLEWRNYLCKEHYTLVNCFFLGDYDVAGPAHPFYNVFLKLEQYMVPARPELAPFPIPKFDEEIIELRQSFENMGVTAKEALTKLSIFVAKLNVRATDDANFRRRHRA